LDFVNKLPKDRAYSVWGSPDYIAPEIISEKGYNNNVDWWSLGILIYRMISGWCPFTDSSVDKILEKIENDKLYIPDTLSDEAQDIVRKLLHKNPKKRLGSGKEGSESIKEHPFFSNIDWEQLFNKETKVPFKPPVEDNEDLWLIGKDVALILYLRLYQILF